MNFINSEFDFNDETLVSCYDEVSLWSAPFGRALLEMVDYKRNILALDLGCGTGYPLLELAMRLGTSSFIYGLDPWPGAMKRTAFKAEQYSVRNIELLECRAEEIPLEDAVIDLIVSNNGLNNVADLSKVAEECGRIAKKGCQMVITVNLNSTMIELYNILRESFLESGIGNRTVNIDNHIRKKRPEVSEIVQLFELNGFRKEREVADSFSYTFADGAALFNHYFMRLAFIESWIDCIPEGHRERVMNDVEQRINSSAEKKNGFSMSVPFVCLEFRKM